MSLLEAIASRQEELAQKWAELTLGTYPDQTQSVWRKNRDQFTNPVGHAILTATTDLMGHLLTWNDAEAVAKSLDTLVKIRAVQDFTPAQAISFVFLLKKLLRQEFLAELKARGALEELLSIETRVDNMATIAFDVYVRSRDHLSRLRVEEIKRAHVNIVRRANMLDKDVAARKAE